jgi:hypothetical protein
MQMYWEKRLKLSWLHAAYITTKLVAATYLSGGIFLYPVAILVFYPTSLGFQFAIVAFCTLFFGLVLSAFGKENSPMEVMTSTAAYVAMLVVFLGTSNSSGSS